MSVNNNICRSNPPSENTISSLWLVHSESVSLRISSGFDYEFVEKLDSKYECSICLLALRNPTQTICGHRFCRGCIINCINGCNKECPIDKKPLSENDLFPDSCVEREVLQLKVKCPNTLLGCSCQVDLRYIEDHMHACVYQPVLCPNECSVTVLQKELDYHLSAQCLHRLTKCKSCNQPFSFNQEQIHLAECPKVIVTCDLCCQEMPRGTVAEHRRDLCPSAEVSCSFVEHGCQFKASRGDVKKHCKNAVEYHIQLLSAAYKKINTLVLDVYRNIGQVASGNFTRQPSLRSQLSQSSMTDGRNSPAHTERTIDSSFIGAVGGSGMSPNSHYGATCGVSTPFDEKLEFNAENEVKQTQLSMLESKKLEPEIADDKGVKTAKHNGTCNQENLLRNISDKCVDMDQRIVEEMIRVDNLMQKIEFVASNMQRLVLDNNARFCNGRFVWKILNFTDVCDEMKEKKSVYHSPPFYSSQYGYKFCLRTNLTVVNEETFLTLYIHLMQGEYDDFIAWPFRGNISLSILDCKNGFTKQHFQENMEVTHAVDAFKRPTSFRGVKGYGYKEFIPLEQLLKPTPSYEYIKNNVVYVKAVVIEK